MIQVDSSEKAHIIKHILDDFDDMGVPWFSCKLPVGDYVNLDNTRISVDRKHNLAEVVNNVGQDHKRFVAELARAQKLGIKLVILIEHSRNIRSVEDVLHWKNPRLAVSPLERKRRQKNALPLREARFFNVDSKKRRFATLIDKRERNRSDSRSGKFRPRSRPPKRRRSRC